MISHGLKEVKIAKLKLPGDMRQRMLEPRVEQRAASIEEHGLIHKPLVRACDMLLIAGRDRVAAHMRLNRETVLVELVDCSDEELPKLEREENMQRRHDPIEQQRLMLEIVQQRTEEVLEREPGIRPSGPGRTQTARGKARRSVAVERGIEPESIRKAEYRERKAKAAELAGKSKEDPYKVCPIRTLGMTLSETFILNVHRVLNYTTQITTLLRRAQGLATELEKSPAPFAKARLERMRDELRAVSHAWDAAKPEALCPACKGLDGLQEECVMCVTTGYITKNQAENISEELWDEEEPRVLYRGKVRFLDEVATELGLPTPVSPPVEEAPW